MKVYTTGSVSNSSLFSYCVVICIFVETFGAVDGEEVICVFTDQIGEGVGDNDGIGDA